MASARRQTAILCLDIGTSSSKAWLQAEINGIERPVPILFGTVEERTPLLPTDIYRTGGRLYFGNEAREQRVLAGEAALGAIKDAVLGRDTEWRTTYQGWDPQDLLSLWSGYLIQATYRALQDNPEWSEGQWNITHRVAVPCVDEESTESNARDTFVRALREGYSIFRGPTPLASGMTVKAALEALREARASLGLHRVQLEDPCWVHEPVAAGTGQFTEVLDDWEREWFDNHAIVPNLTRRLLLVLDVGGGTTDAALFQTFRWTERDPTTIFGLLRAGRYGVPIGGEDIVNAVSKHTENHPALAGATPARKGYIGRRTAYALLRYAPSPRRSVRTHEGATFAREEIETLPSYVRIRGELRSVVETTLTKSLSVPSVHRIGARLPAHGKGWPVWLLTTGGSRRFAAVHELTQVTVQVGPTRFTVSPLQARLPAGIRHAATPELREKLSDRFGELAVAIGGAVKDLPSSQDLEDLVEA